MEINEYEGRMRGKFWIEASIKDKLISSVISENKVRSFFKNYDANPLNNIYKRLFLKHSDGKAMLLWKRKRLSFRRSGIRCMLFVNNSDKSTFDLLSEATSLARVLWMESPFFIHLDLKYFADDIEESLFKLGWSLNGTTKSGKKVFILESDEKTI